MGILPLPSAPPQKSNYTIFQLDSMAYVLIFSNHSFNFVKNEHHNVGYLAIGR